MNNYKWKPPIDYRALWKVAAKMATGEWEYIRGQCRTCGKKSDYPDDTMPCSKRCMPYVRTEYDVEMEKRLKEGEC
jgi:hypothetical protein